MPLSAWALIPSPHTGVFLPLHVYVEPFQFRANLVRQELDPKPVEVDVCAVSHL